MAKFKVGDRVRIERWNKPTIHGKLLKYENGTATIEQDGAETVSYKVNEDGIKPINSAVRGEDGQLAHPRASLLYPVKNASALNAVRVGMKDTNGRDISIGDRIQDIDSKMKGKVIGKYNEYLLLVDWDGGFQEEVHPSDTRIMNSRACNSTNSVVANAIAAWNTMRDNGDVLVEFQTLGASGLERVSKKMSSTEFRDWLTKTGNGAKEQEVWHALMKGDKTSLHHSGIEVFVKAL